MTQGRETVDRMRDLCWEATATWAVPYTRRVALADLLFAVVCESHVLRYRDRVGLKEGVAADRDVRTAAWWGDMAAHVRNPGRYPDPRSCRPGFFVAYTWPPEPKHVSPVPEPPTFLGHPMPASPLTAPTPAPVDTSRFVRDLLAMLETPVSALVQVEQDPTVPSAWLQALRLLHDRLTAAREAKS